MVLRSVVLLTTGHPALARVLTVGAGQSYESPSAAASVAQDGDQIDIETGTYFDCAVWQANRLTIAALGPDVVITDRACAGKAAFVISGNDVLVQGLAFSRIRVPDGNGAGIRAEGTNLTVADSQFVNNQIGILAAATAGTLRIIGCTFRADGVSADQRPTHGVSAGRLDRLHIERSIFEAARGGDHIASAARQTELVGNRLTDEGNAMTGPLVSIQGGAVTLDGNVVELAAGSADRPGAVLVFGQASYLLVHGNTLIEPRGDVPLLRNWSGQPASEDANTVPPNVPTVSDSGTTYHRLRSRMAILRGQAHVMLAAARHQVAQLARALHLIP